MCANYLSLILCCLAWIAHCKCQDKASVYELDFLNSQRAGTDAEAVSLYWLQLAKREVYQLEGGKRPEILAARPQLPNRLREILRPIFELEDMLANLPPGEAREEIGTRLVEALRDEATADAAFATLGPEYAQELATERLGSDLKTIANRKLKTSFEVNPLVNNNALLETLGLASDQELKLSKEFEKVSLALAKKTKKLMKELALESDKRWQELLEAMDGSQSKMAKQLLGRPVEWFRIPKTNRVQRDGETWLKTYVCFSGSKTTDALKGNSKSLFELEQAELEKHGIEKFGSLAYELLFATSLWSEYELVQPQRNELTKTIRLRLNEYGLVVPDDQRRIVALIDGSATYPKTITDLLLPNQLKWFRQMELQVLLKKKFDSSVGLLNPTMISTLELRPAQTKTMRKIAKKYKAIETAILSELAKETRLANANFQTRVADTLTKQQREKLDAIVSEVK